jgi:DNA-binding CsgD family transcriptional regulator
MRLYQLLLQRGSAPRDDITAEAALTPDLAAGGWDHLAKLGLVRETAAGNEVSAITPDTALAGILAQQRSLFTAHVAEADRLSQAAADLTGKYRRAVANESASARVEIVRGSAAHRAQLLIDMNQQTRRRSDSMHPGPLPSADVLAESLAEDAKLLQRGVHVRAIYGQTAAQANRTRKYLTGLAALGAEIRLAPHVPFDLLIGDADLAYLLITAPTGDGGMAEVRGELLIATCQAMYDYCWLQATPYRPDHDSPTTDEHQLSNTQLTVLRLMCDGLSDEQICQRLGISTRTLRRYLTQIMTHLGAHSRVHAGVLASQRGFLDSEKGP